MKILSKYILLIALMFCFNLTSASAQSANMPVSKKVTAIEVQGNKTISIATVLSKIKTRVGQDYLQSVISDDLKRLYNTGYFSDVRVDRQDLDDGYKVIIYLEEKSVIEEITFSKTRFIKTKTLERKIKSKAGKFLDNKSLQDDIFTIKDVLEQKGLTLAEVEVETVVDEVANKVNVHFVIREGYRITVDEINIEGNDSYKRKKILKLIKTRDKWLFNAGHLKEEKLREDMERIVSFYSQQGFIDARAEYSIHYWNKWLVEVNIRIYEGKQYSVGRVAITGNDIISDGDIEDVMAEIKEGGIFSRERLSLDLSNIRTLYFDRGYIFAAVNESTSLDPATGQVETLIDITEGSLAYIDQVKIQGNTRTRDAVIRRELRMFPGDKFDGTKIKRSKDRLNNLGYFEEVHFDIADTDRYDRKDLVVQVKETKTGAFSFGGGFSTVDQVVGFVEIEQRNFDITNWPTFTGGGQKLQLRSEIGSSKGNVFLSFTEPWIFDNPVSGGFDAYKTQRDQDDDSGYAYDEKRLGGVLRFGNKFSEYLSGGLSYKIENVEIENFKSDVSADLLAEGGKNTISMVGFSILKDRKGSKFSPTKGYWASSNFDVAGGFLGGDKDFYRWHAGGAYYIPLKYKSVLEFRGKVGFVNAYGKSDTVPIFERFFAGGAKSIRGYEERKAGPLDSSTNDPIGGESIFVANIEYTVPLVDLVKLAVFIDTGNVWSKVEELASDEFLTGTGIGFRIKTPIGPVNLDYGYPLNDEPGENDKSGKFYFSMSRGF